MVTRNSIGTVHHESNIHEATHGSEAAQAATEFAVVLPVMLLLLLAIIQFGQLIMVDMELTSASRDGARRAAVARTEDDPVTSVKNVVKSSLDRIEAEDIQVQVDGGWEQDDTVMVTASTPHELDILGVEVWSGTLRSQSTVRIG